MAFVVPHPTPASLRSSWTPTSAPTSPRRPHSIPARRRSPPRAVLAAPPDNNNKNNNKSSTSTSSDSPLPESFSDLERMCFLPGMVHAIATPEQFDALRAQAKREGAVLVADFMAAWCRKCLYLVPRLRKLAAAHRRAYFCTIDVNAVHRLPREFAIRKMPTFVFIRDGAVEHSFVAGAAPDKVAAQLAQVVDKYVDA